MKYLVRSLNNTLTFDSEKELLEYIFYKAGEQSENSIYKIKNYTNGLKTYEINEIDISKLDNYDFYKIQKRDLLINKINTNNLKIAYYEIELDKVIKIDCREFKSFLSDKILKLYEENKTIEEELKQYE